MINNVLAVGDIHAPFDIDGYLDFNVSLYRKYRCTEVVFIGDVLDSHAWSYHESDPDGLSAGDELAFGIKRLQLWYKAFPKANILYGNHDLLVSRKAKTAGLSKHFIRDFGDIIEAPRAWNFHHSYKKDEVNYIHGSTGNAGKRMRDTRMNTVQGHLHSQSAIEYSVSEKDKLWSLQVGCGIDRHKYAFAYGKDFAKKPVIGSGLVLENGRLPVIELMDL